MSLLTYVNVYVIDIRLFFNAYFLIYAKITNCKINGISTANRGY